MRKIALGRVCVGVVLVWVVAGDVATNHELSNSRTNESKIKGAKAENTETDKVQKLGMVLGVVVVLLWWHRDLLSHGRTGSVTRKAQ